MKRKSVILKVLCLGLVLFLAGTSFSGGFSGKLKANAETAKETVLAQETESRNDDETSPGQDMTGAEEETSAVKETDRVSESEKAFSDSERSEQNDTVDETTDETAGEAADEITDEDADEIMEEITDEDSLSEKENDPLYEHITSITTDLALNSGAVVQETGTLSKSTCVTFATYHSGNWHCNRYLTTGAHNYYHHYYTSRISYMKMDGTYAYCVEPNTVSADDIKYTGYSDDSAKSSSYWMLELDKTQRTYIQKILAFGYPNKTYGYGKQATYAATQTLIWEVVSKCRYKSLASTTSKGLYNKVAAVLGTNYKKAYSAILQGAVNSFSNGKVPSFASSTKSSAKAITLKLNANTECYEASVTDKNKVLPYYQAEVDGIDFSYSGNTLKISVPVTKAAKLKDVVVKMSSELMDPDSMDTEIWENKTYQTVVTKGSASAMKAYFKLTWEEEARVKLKKTAYNPVTKGKVPETGAVFRMWKKSAGSYKKASAAEKTTITIDDTSAGISDYMPLGTYCIRQYSGWDGYDLLEDTIEVELKTTGETVTKDTEGNSLVYKDRMWTGTIEILKVDGDSDKPLKGAIFQLTGSDGSIETLETGTNGKISFGKLQYGVTYKWKELKAPEGYEIAQNSAGTWRVDEQDALLQVECENFKEKYGSITVQKTDYAGKNLAGCTFKLEYLVNGVWKPVLKRSSDGILKGRSTNQNINNGCLTTGKTGKVSFTGLMVGNIKYRLTETAAPEGYELLSDPVIYEGTLPLKTALKDVDEDYVMKNSDESEGDYLYSYDLSFSIKDQSRFTLPVTGAGEGINPVAIIAVMGLLTGTRLFMKKQIP